MTALQGSQINVEEADALVEALLASTDPRRTAWEATDEDDKPILLRAATAKIAACNWKGAPTDSEQGLPWPRVHPSGLAVGGTYGTSAPVPDGAAFSTWSVPGCPAEVYNATAIQAGAEAARALGLDDSAAIQSDAQRGVASRSAGSGSTSLDLARAGSPRARLDPDAWTLMQGLFAWGGSAA